MQMSQTMSVEDARKFMHRASRLVNDGMVLDKRHYDTCKHVFQMYAHDFLNSKWFGEWVRTHQEWLVMYFGKTDAPTFETIMEYVQRKDEERLQRMLRRMRNGN